ncbi:LytR/AlgR family response regulator transcription factor [Flavivirga algicola]|uniref:Response regulator transcription factor n=1 Tax=Flavivirga algicola TaxID=2729136 RepID=A0ABX1S575_9FLAO|nr:LytTR family DNA-binding domain-containing protein [Flavivirga algicola]NMH89584.1 response regulator transcription factor [Flavivirga algicola]
MIKCLVVDDEPLARECIENYIQQVDFLEFAGSCKSALELSSVLEQTKVDVLFLDIQMPIMNGLEFLKVVENPPITILTTAFPNYAVEGFNLNVLDYLLKPIVFNRFFAAAMKVKKALHLQYEHPTSLLKDEEDCFFIKCDGRYVKIFTQDILFIEAMQNYVIIQTHEKRFITHLYLKNVAEKLNPEDFLRVHKSFIVAKSKIESASTTEIQIQSYKIPISRSYKKDTLLKVLDGKLWGGIGKQ